MIELKWNNTFQRQAVLLKLISFAVSLVAFVNLNAQSFVVGADLSYVNEMEDCGVSYYENGAEKDVYEIFSDNGCQVARIRLWHKPSWYADINDGNLYSTLSDAKKSIQRAHEAGMQVLLDFHLSDTWADPSSQLVPEAWLPVVNDLETLQDSLYNYIYNTLSDLSSNDLLPEMIQIGNETNKGILLSPSQNSSWVLNWDRNAVLFNRAIDAVKDVENQVAEDIKIVLHMAGPANAEWLMDGFITNGVTDFDIIGISYYWAWHKPTSISETGDIIKTLKQLYPDKSSMIVETGYIWTTEWNDNASNIISDTHPDYSPASPENQRDWLIEMTDEVRKAGGAGVLYWEPAWVSSPCYTLWGQGSHQEHATFFDFNNQLITNGGIEWMNQNVQTSIVNTALNNSKPIFQVLTNSFSGDIRIKQLRTDLDDFEFVVADTSGNVISTGRSKLAQIDINISNQLEGIYFISVSDATGVVETKKMLLSDK